MSHFEKITNSPSTIDEARVEALAKYAILDTATEQEYEDITFLAAQICNVPVSTITFIDASKQWFKAKIGLEHKETPKEISFCAAAIQYSDAFVNIPDVFDNENFKEIAILNGMKSGFYASVILVDKESNVPIGTLCVIDSERRNLSENQILGLKKLGTQLSNLLELRLKNKTLLTDNSILNFQYSELKQFANVVSHDIKSPLNNIISLSNLLKEEFADKLNNTGLQYLDYISESSYSLKHFVDAMLNFYSSSSKNIVTKEVVDISAMTIKVFNSLNYKDDHQILVQPDLKIISNEFAIEQILLNLISNGIKYNSSEKVVIEVKLIEKEKTYELEIKDNGIGILKENFDTIFDFFKTLGSKDRFDNYGTGIGLATVKNLVDKLGGTITLNSEINKGTVFSILLPK